MIVYEAAIFKLLYTKTPSVEKHNTCQSFACIAPNIYSIVKQKIVLIPYEYKIYQTV